MTHRHGHRGGGCHGFGHRRFPNREDLLKWLEEYQRDLEQEVADVADVVRKLKDETAAAPTV